MARQFQRRPSLAIASTVPRLAAVYVWAGAKSFEVTPRLVGEGMENFALGPYIGAWTANPPGSGRVPNSRRYRRMASSRTRSCPGCAWSAYSHSPAGADPTAAWKRFDTGT